MKSTEVIIEAPFSFAGSAKRLWRVTDNKWLLVLVIVPLIGLAWSIIACWYIFFGALLVPYRLIRRSSRKQKRDNLRHDELIEALRPGKPIKMTVRNNEDSI
jgi:hypothetical protein